MVKPNSPSSAGRHGQKKPKSLLSLVLQQRQLALVAVFFAGTWFGWNLNQEHPPINDHALGKIHPRTQTGWKTIDVFYGSSESYESLLQERFFSQAGQDRAVLALLGNKTGGFFVDLAANHAWDLSNTYALEKHYGWKGLCIEPNSRYWYSLTHLRKNCQLVGAVVGRRRMEEVDFKYQNMETGGIVGEDFDNGKNQRRYSRKEYTVTLSEIFARFEVPRVIDYLSLDVEGAEEFILGVFPLDEYRIRIMSVERPNTKLREYLNQHGYKQVQRLISWGETLWIHGSFEAEMDMSRLDDFNAKNQRSDQRRREKEREERLARFEKRYGKGSFSY